MRSTGLRVWQHRSVKGALQQLECSMGKPEGQLEALALMESLQYMFCVLASALQPPLRPPPARFQLYEALRSLGHNLSAPRRDPATGAEAEPLSRAPSGASMPRAPSGASMSRASSSASVAGGAAPQAPATAEAFWEALKKVGGVGGRVECSKCSACASNVHLGSQKL